MPQNGKQPQKLQRYFWFLDNELTGIALQRYQDNLQGEGKSTGLLNCIRLLQARVPIPARVYLTQDFFELARMKPNETFFEELSASLERLERISHSQLGNAQKPLLLTVSGDFCGAVRNIGVCKQSLRALVHHYGSATAYTLYVDFLESYSSLVLGCPRIDFRETFGLSAVREGGAGGLADLSEEVFQEKVRAYQNLISQKIGRPFPQEPEKHLMTTLLQFAKASDGIGGDEIVIHSQVHKSQYGKSMQGVVYSRDPFSGKQELYGAVELGEKNEKCALQDTGKGAFRDSHPSVYALLKKYLPEIETAFRDVMEVEFVTDDDGHLFFTNFDKAHTTSRATVVSAIELANSHIISDEEAAKRIKPNDVEVLLHPTLDEESRKKLEDIGSVGVTAAPGTAVGYVFFKMADAMEFYRQAKKKKEDPRVILIADELLISDTPGLGIISGLVTKASGIASHAAVMARANGIPCIVGYQGLEFTSNGKEMSVNGKKYKAKTLLTLEAGSEGRLFVGEGRLQNLSYREGVVKEVAELIDRVIKSRQIPVEVRVNINNAKDAETGLVFGADGVGLCRTENMFMGEEALTEIRNIVFSRDPDLTKESVDKLEEIQFEDFKKIFEVMKERTVNIRLMDLPLHDFSPQSDSDFAVLDKQLPHLDKAHLRAMAEELREHNPMLGLRACRYGLMFPQVYEMQIRAIVRAAYDVAQRGIKTSPGIMFPLVYSERELSRLRDKVLKVEEEVREKLCLPYDSKIQVKVGTMIELPAAALAADRLAQLGEFFAFGTNDLTQTTLGISRDDSAHYLPFYLENQLLPADPFKVLNPSVRELIELAVKRGRRVRGDSSFGICGEQGGDPNSLRFCMEKGLNYVSCSPFRVLPARMSLVQVALDMGSKPKVEKVATAEKTSRAEAKVKRLRPRAYRSRVA